MSLSITSRTKANSWTIYDGRVIVLKNHQVLEEYDSEGVAYIETKKTHEPGTFLIQRVSPGTEAYTSTYHSRVVFG